jgi:hypothetical protein
MLFYLKEGTSNVHFNYSLYTDFSLHINEWSFEISRNKAMHIVMPVYNPSVPKAEAGGSRVSGHPGLHSKILSQTEKNKTKQKQ